MRALPSARARALACSRSWRADTGAQTRALAGGRTRRHARAQARARRHARAGTRAGTRAQARARRHAHAQARARAGTRTRRHAHAQARARRHARARRSARGGARALRAGSPRPREPSRIALYTEVAPGIGMEIPPELNSPFRRRSLRPPGPAQFCELVAYALRAQRRQGLDSARLTRQSRGRSSIAHARIAPVDNRRASLAIRHSEPPIRRSDTPTQSTHNRGSVFKLSTISLSLLSYVLYLIFSLSTLSPLLLSD